jgi:predicted membrane protein
VTDEEAAAGAVESAPVANPPVPDGAEKPSWLYVNRLKVALGIAVVEGILVALENDFSRWTVIVLAIPIVLFYLLAGRSLDSQLGREISWVLAMSQALAVVAAIIAITIPAIALVLAGIFGVVALYLLYHDRPDRDNRANTTAD